MQMQKIQLIHGNCETEIQKLPDESVDVILTDPPYGIMCGLDLRKVIDGKTGRNGCYSWDRALDLDLMFSEFKRVLKERGRLIIFSQNKFTQEVRTKSDADLKYLYPLYWRKNQFGNKLLINVAPLSYVEDISVFEKLTNKGKYGELPKTRAYAKKVMDFIGKNSGKINKDLGHERTDHFFRHSSIQFTSLAEDVYNQLIDKYGIDKMDGFLTYKELDAMYQGERGGENGLAKVAFNIPEGKGHVSNLLEFKKDYPSQHPTQKPVALLQHLIEVFTKPEAVILDTTMGSGSTGVACVNTGRSFIGIELSERYFEVAKNRIAEAERAKQCETQSLAF